MSGIKYLYMPIKHILENLRKKCLKVRQVLGTWKLWKFENLKTWQFENFENIKKDPWDMLNNFCFPVYAQKSLFIGENVMFF